MAPLGLSIVVDLQRARSTSPRMQRHAHKCWLCGDVARAVRQTTSTTPVPVHVTTLHTKKPLNLGAVLGLFLRHVDCALGQQVSGKCEDAAVYVSRQ